MPVVPWQGKRLLLEHLDSFQRPIVLCEIVFAQQIKPLRDRARIAIRYAKGDIQSLIGFEFGLVKLLEEDQDQSIETYVGWSRVDDEGIHRIEGLSFQSDPV